MAICKAKVHFKHSSISIHWFSFTYELDGDQVPSRNIGISSKIPVRTKFDFVLLVVCIFNLMFPCGFNEEKLSTTTISRKKVGKIHSTPDTISY